MTTPDISQKLQETSDFSDEDIRPISLVNTEQNIINDDKMNGKSLSYTEQSTSNEDTVNCNSSPGNAMSTGVPSKETSSKGEGNVLSNNEVAKLDPSSMGDKIIRSNSEPSNDTNSKGDGNLIYDSVVTTNDTIGEESVRGNNMKTEDKASEGANDVVDGNVIGRVRSFCEEHDDEMKSYKVQLYSCNQAPGNKGGFLKMVVDDRNGLKVTTTGVQYDPHTLWLTHYTLDGERRQVVIFENERCSRETGVKCVLYTQHVGDSVDYILTGKKIDSIPARLGDIDHFTGFLKRPKAIGSELLYLKSMLTSKERPLLVGFDGAGQPIPLNRVEKYSHDFQAFFRILEAD